MIKLLQRLGLLAQKPQPFSPEALAYVEQRLASHRPSRRRTFYVGEGTFRTYLEKNAEANVARRAKRIFELNQRAKKQEQT
jgi:hypothetical protein